VTAERVGFIGLGIMGRPMAGRLLAAGVPLTVASRSLAADDEIVAAGATYASSPSQLASGCDVVISMLPDTPDVTAVLLGDCGVADALQPGALVIDMSTITPAGTRVIADGLTSRGVMMLDAPVSGGEAGAVAGMLSIMAGGPQAAFARALPLLELLGKNIVHVGPQGAGQVAKACNQLIVAATIEAVAEALCLAARAGVDPSVVRTAMTGGFADSRVLQVHGQRMLDRTFQPGFRARMHRKDARIVLDAAGQCGAQVPAFTVVAAQLDRLVDQAGSGELDHSALLTLLETWPGSAGSPEPGETAHAGA
jgi:2-hydroxy-3-oxopropionate reductase